MNDKATLQDCLNEYLQYMRESELKLQKEELDRKLKAEALVVEAFLSVGLEPTRIEGWNAFFDLDGKEVHFVINEWKYGGFGVCRVLDDKCVICGDQLATDEFAISRENIGFLLQSPTKRYHGCFGFGVDESETQNDAPSKADQLIALLKEILQESIA